MLKVYFWLRRLIERQEGQGMTEYGLIIALVAVVVIVSLTALGSGLNTKFLEICKAVTGNPC